MRIEKKTLNDALRGLGKVVCQTSQVELYCSVRFVGDENGIRAMVTDVDENFGLAREGQKMFGVMRINKSNSSDWSRCIGLQNSHDNSFAVGLSVGISVTVCSNLAFGGTTVIKRRQAAL